ncbi:MAG: hypoxanthine phosphoribosyltransferase [Zetaproteobacteria bacterium]|nr:hypoxanthine phosphoribosyltransferase [Zetaproteobacteria bacterium]
MATVRSLISAEQIATRLVALAGDIQQCYGEQTFTLLCVLKGSFIFAADLIRQLPTRVEIQFVTASSYVGTQSSGHVHCDAWDATALRGKHVLIVEDIVDTGTTLRHLQQQLQPVGVASLKVAALLTRTQATAPAPDFSGFALGDEFVVGYGLDLDQKYRSLPYIGVVEP